jgi:hypothetical protein
MFQQTSVTQAVDAPAADVWAVLQTGTDLHLYVGLITACEVDRSGALPSGVGARRTCHTADGPLRERIETVDDDTRTIQYSIRELPMPITDVLGTVRVRETGPDTSEVTWSLNYEVAEEQAEAFDGFTRSVYADAIAGLGRVVRSEG